MVNPFAETPAEKRELALHMYHNGHTYREICKEVHLSPSTLSSIIKSESGDTEDSESQLVNKSKESRAYALYDKNKRPLEVSIQLDIPAERAIEYYEKFQDLKCMPLEDRQIKLIDEINQLESKRIRTNTQLIDLRNQVIASNRMLEYYKLECERLLVLYCHRKQLVGH